MGMRFWRRKKRISPTYLPVTPHTHQWEAIIDPSYLGVGAVTGYRCVFTGCSLVMTGVAPDFILHRRTVVIGGTTLYNVHPLEACEGMPCTIDHPSDHHMRGWPLHWRSDRRIFERICPHGVGHPDPDGINPDTIHGCSMPPCYWAPLTRSMT